MREMLEEDFKRLLKEFDFGKVRQVMLALDWKWYHIKPAIVPTVSEMKTMVSNLFNSIINEGWVTASSGGFTLSNVDGCLWLKFIVEEAEIIPEIECEDEYEGY